MHGSTGVPTDVGKEGDTTSKAQPSPARTQVHLTSKVQAKEIVFNDNPEFHTEALQLSGLSSLKNVSPTLHTFVQMYKEGTTTLLSNGAPTATQQSPTKIYQVTINPQGKTIVVPIQDGSATKEDAIC